MLTAITIAALILRRLKAKNKTCTSHQLVKLAYIAYGWGLAVFNKKIFYDRIEAWRYGPVIPDLYYATKRYGHNPIPSDALGDIDDSKFPEIDNVISLLLDDVISAYGDFTGIQLSSMTHEADSPWKMVYNEHQRHIKIPDKLIKIYYESKLENV